MSRTTSSIAIAALAAVLVASVTVPLVSSSAAAGAAAATCGRAHTPGDVDGDGKADVLSPGRAALVLNLSRGGGQVVRTADLGRGFTEAYSGFAESVVLGDLDADGCADAVVSVIESSTDPDVDTNTHHLLVLLGSPTGLRSVGNVRIPGTSTTGTFESTPALALHRRSGTPTYDLWIGLSVGRIDGPGAGKVMHFRTSPRGTSFTATKLRSFTQNSKGVPGTSRTGDDFGATLAAFEGGVMVGARFERVGRLASAGSVTQLRTRGDGSLIVAHTWTLSSRSVQRLEGAPKASSRA